MNQWNPAWDERSFTDWARWFANKLAEPHAVWVDNLRVARERWAGLFTTPCDAHDELMIANARLLNNPTITVYRFVDGVEQRQITSPWHDGAMDFADAMASAQLQKAAAFSKAQ